MPALTYGENDYSKTTKVTPFESRNYIWYNEQPNTGDPIYKVEIMKPTTHTFTWAVHKSDTDEIDMTTGSSIINPENFDLSDWRVSREMNIPFGSQYGYYTETYTTPTGIQLVVYEGEYE